MNKLNKLKKKLIKCGKVRVLNNRECLILREYGNFQQFTH